MIHKNLNGSVNGTQVEVSLTFYNSDNELCSKTTIETDTKDPSKITLSRFAQNKKKEIQKLSIGIIHGGKLKLDKNLKFTIPEKLIGAFNQTLRLEEFREVEKLLNRGGKISALSPAL